MDDVSSAAEMDESHNDSWPQFEPEEWRMINFDDSLNWPHHLIQGENDHQPALAASPNAALDYELVNASQPTDEAAQVKHQNTQTLNRESEEPPGLAELAELPHRLRLGQSRSSVTVQSHSDSSTPSNTLNFTPGSSSASPWPPARHGSESFQPHSAPHSVLSSPWEMESLDALRLENEAHAGYSFPSDNASTVMPSYDISEQGFGASSWAWVQGPGLTDAQYGVQTLTDEFNNSFPFVPTAQAIEASHYAPASTIREPCWSIPVCFSPPPNQAPPSVPSDPGTHDHQRAKRKRDKDDAQSRTQTNKVRAMGACLRCRIYKEKCDLKSPCSRCIKVAGSAKLFTQPCKRLDLTDVIPFRTGNARMGQTESVFPKLEWIVGSPNCTALVTHFIEGVDMKDLPTLQLLCRQFSPTQDDVLFEHYEDENGQVILVRCPPIASMDIEFERKKRELGEYMRKILPFAVNEMLATSKNEIYRHGLAEAHRLAFRNSSPIPMLQKALEILACVHLNFDTPILVDDTLGVPILRDKRSPNQGRYPVPSVLDFQLDTLCIQHMQKLMKEVSSALKKVIFSKERHTRWYEIYLTIFVLLVSTEQVYLTQFEYLQGATAAHDRANIFAHASPVTNYMLDLWRTSAKHLLYHYRCVMKGTLPFSTSFKLENEGYALLDNEAIKYIRETAALVREREVEFRALGGSNFDNFSAMPLYWISKLFLDPIGDAES